jgi:hypothetical protein
MTIFVLSMGRCGSRSIVFPLRAANQYAGDIHSLEPGHKLDGFKTTPEEDADTANAVSTLEGVTRVLVPIREPIARCLSSFFHHYREYPNSRVVDLGRALEWFEQHYPFDWTLDWVEREIEGHLGVPVYAAPRVSGTHVRLEYNEFDVLIVLQSVISHALPNLLRRYWGVNVKGFPRINAGSSQMYDYVTRNRCLSRSLVDRIYAHKYSTHFFSDELLSLTDRWSRR